jgi:hypothetical protein
MNRPRLSVASCLNDVPLEVVLAAEFLVTPIARVRLEPSVGVHVSRERALVGASCRTLGASESVALCMDNPAVALQA